MKAQEPHLPPSSLEEGSFCQQRAGNVPPGKAMLWNSSVWPSTDTGCPQAAAPSLLAWKTWNDRRVGLEEGCLITALRVVTVPTGLLGYFFILSTQGSREEQLR